MQSQRPGDESYVLGSEDSECVVDEFCVAGGFAYGGG